MSVRCLLFTYMQAKLCGKLALSVLIPSMRRFRYWAWVTPQCGPHARKEVGIRDEAGSMNYTLSYTCWPFYSVWSHSCLGMDYVTEQMWTTCDTLSIIILLCSTKRTSYNMVNRRIISQPAFLRQVKILCHWPGNNSFKKWSSQRFYWCQCGKNGPNSVWLVR